MHILTLCNKLGAFFSSRNKYMGQRTRKPETISIQMEKFAFFYNTKLCQMGPIQLHNNKYRNQWFTCEDDKALCLFLKFHFNKKSTTRPYLFIHCIIQTADTQLFKYYIAGQWFQNQQTCFSTIRNKKIKLKPQKHSI